MVKLAHTIGASSVAQSVRQATTLGSAVVEVRQGTWDDLQARHMFRVMPFTDIQYSGPEVAALNSVIASCLVPTVTGVDTSNENAHTGYLSGPKYARKMMSSSADLRQMATEGYDQDWHRDRWSVVSGYGMSDYLMGYSHEASAATAQEVGGGIRFDRARRALWSGSPDSSGAFDAGMAHAPTEEDTSYVMGTFPIRVVEWTNEDQALDAIANNPTALMIGYVVSARDVKLFYTQTAIAMIIRRMHRVVETLGPFRPIYTHIGLGHVTQKGEAWRPTDPKRVKGKPDDDTTDAYETAMSSASGALSICPPSMGWNAGNVSYSNRVLPASGTLYIPQDQVPYSMMRRGFKYNHILTALGLELMETLQAVGANFSSDARGNLTNDLKYTGESTHGAQIAQLQLLFGSMFGSTRGATNAGDFEADPTTTADSLKDMLGLLFNSGHIHIDPGVLTHVDGGYNGSRLSGQVGSSGIKYRGQPVAPSTLMGEFIQKFIVFAAACTAMRGLFSMPLYDCHWLYSGSPKPEYVIEQLQMNYRPDVVFDGGGTGSEYTLIPSRLNPGEILERVPCLMNETTSSPNTYLGIRDALPYGGVQDIRFHGDKPLTTIEEREYTFTPIIEADANVMATMRNGRAVNIAVLPRPSSYAPGVSPLGIMASTMLDNSTVGGSYYFQYQTGPYFMDTPVRPGERPRSFRAFGDIEMDPLTQGRVHAGQTPEEQATQAELLNRRAITADTNPQAATHVDGVFSTGGPALIGSALGVEGDEV